ncbi:hypothetical protein M436DRAFT_77879 [Aureobasidium namibiae CBS 147.97]|uniref:Uncharacterized protein n=1 Tax=Aureobasidium namibiae CBS 147.97 TaxID=1043004 RepID=A0A074WXV7_9PEZI
MPSEKKEMPYSWELVVEANHRGTIEDLDLALLAAFEESEEAYNICIDSARANASVFNKADRLAYLLDEGHIDINKIGAASVSNTYKSSPIECAAVLVSRGWNINQRQPLKGKYNTPVNTECDKKLTDETLLADVASFGSTDTFKLLHEYGAPISESTLHNAAWRARPEMVTFLIDEIGLDMNKVYEGRHEPMLLHQTPLASAAISPFLKAGEVINILLERGADPYHKDCNAFDEARGDSAIKILREWEQKEQKEDQEGPKTKKRKTSK